jgi:hypothetical protein
MTTISFAFFGDVPFRHSGDLAAQAQIFHGPHEAVKLRHVRQIPDYGGFVFGLAVTHLLAHTEIFPASARISPLYPSSWWSSFPAPFWPQNPEIHRVFRHGQCQSLYDIVRAARISSNGSMRNMFHITRRTSAEREIYDGNDDLEKHHD